MAFCGNFVWGAASSAYQYEGATSLGGRGTSVWDTFCRQKGATANDENADISCDGYHRAQEDILLMAQLGIRAYRFSISWVRIDPLGDGTLNPEGFAYYDRVVNCCLANGITPYVTLFHWDLPQPLEDAGGWSNRCTVSQFAVYAAAVARHFAGRVKYYFTLNEPECVVSLGYMQGIHAPGKRLSDALAARQLHGMVLAHAAAQKAIRHEDKNALVGIATTGKLCYPAGESSEDIAAARQETFTCTETDWIFSHAIVLDAVCHGKYPSFEGEAGEVFSSVQKHEQALLKSVPDFIGLNVYNGHEIACGEDGNPVYTPRHQGFPATALKWPVTPEVLRWGPRFIYEKYDLPIFITENGQSCNDRIFLDGKVHDADRIDFMHRYLKQLSKASDDGADIKGYFAWSLTDNFEWHSGYGERFGLIFIDYPTQKRILKDSAYWYGQIIAQNGNTL